MRPGPGGCPGNCFALEELPCSGEEEEKGKGGSRSVWDSLGKTVSKMEAKNAPILRSGRLMFPTLMKLTDDDVEKIWDSVSRYILQQLALNKGVRIIGLGTFTLIKHFLPGREFELLHVLKPVFQVSEHFARIHGLRYTKATSHGTPPAVLLNYAQLSQDTKFPRVTVEGCVQESLLFLSCTVASGHDVDFVFKDLGILVVRGNKVKMLFYKDFLQSLDETGRLTKSVLHRPWTMDSAISCRASAISQNRPDSTVVFPKIRVHIPPPIKSTGEGTEKISDQKQLPRKSENCNSKGTSPGKCNLLSQDTLSPTRITAEKAEGDQAKMGKELEPSMRLPPLGEGSSCKKGEEGKPSKTRSQADVPVCDGHKRAGQEVCYLCMQQEQRKLRALLAEEARQKEEEEERLWTAYQAQRAKSDRERAQLRSQAQNLSAQKVQVFLQAVAEMKRKEKTE